MIALALGICAIGLVAFGILVAGIRGSERRMSLEHSSPHGFADAFTRKVLGVYVRQEAASQQEHDCTQARK